MTVSLYSIACYLDYWTCILKNRRLLSRLNFIVNTFFCFTSLLPASQTSDRAPCRWDSRYYAIWMYILIRRGIYRHSRWLQAWRIRRQSQSNLHLMFMKNDGHQNFVVIKVVFCLLFLDSVSFRRKVETVKCKRKHHKCVIDYYSTIELPFSAVKN